MNTTALKSKLGSKVQALGDPVVMPVPVVPEATIAPAESSYVALSTNALEIIRANLKHQALSLDLFDVVKSPAGGSTVFTVPGLAGDEAAKELTGIILDYSTPRAYWDTPDPVEGTPPVCMSKDSIVSKDGKPCAHCPFNDFGSKNGESNAKACKESVLLFLLRPNNIIPLLVRVPVTSKPRFLKYATRLLSCLTPINGVVTKITLEKATSKSGKPYALYNFEAVNILTPEEADQARTFAQQFMSIVDAAEVAAELSEAS